MIDATADEPADGDGSTRAVALLLPPIVGPSTLMSLNDIHEDGMPGVPEVSLDSILSR